MGRPTLSPPPMKNRPGQFQPDALGQGAANMSITHVQGDLSKMRTETPYYFKDMPLAHHYCQGKGIELGAAAHNPFNLPDCINVAPWSDDPTHVDYADYQFYCSAQVEMCGHYAKVDLVGEAHDIPVPDHSYDYILSSHVVEHLPNLIAAFLEWNRILKPSGVIFIIFPKRDALASDIPRPITPLEKFIEDYRLNRTIDDHPGVKKRAHYYVFTLGSMLDLIDWCNDNLGLQWQVETVEESDSKAGNGHTVVCRYLPGASIDNREFLSRHTGKNRPPTSFIQNATAQAEAAPSGRVLFKYRARQLLATSRSILADEGVSAFLTRFVKWLGGERRFHRGP